MIHFAGTTKTGSKRSIKIWSREGLLNVAAAAGPSTVNILSDRDTRLIGSKHPTLSPQLFAYQPIKMKDNLYLLHDADFLDGQEDDTVVSADSTEIKGITCGFSCDLFLTCWGVFELEKGTLRSLKALMLRKWQRLAGATNLKSVIPLFYRASSFSSSYTEWLRTWINRIGTNNSGEASPTLSAPDSQNPATPAIIPRRHLIISREPSGTPPFRGYRKFVFAPIQQEISLREPKLMPIKCPQYMYPNFVENIIPLPPGRKFWAANSEGFYVDVAVTTVTSQWTVGFMKESQTVSAELAAVPHVMQFFPPNRVQKVVAADESSGRQFFVRFSGFPLNESRMTYSKGRRDQNGDSYQRNPVKDEFFLNMELRRCEDVLAAWQATLRSNRGQHSASRQKIQNFYFFSLQYDTRLREMYGKGCLQWLDKRRYECTPFETLLKAPLVINGQTYPPLRKHLDRARRALDPNTLNQLPIAFGLAKGHGGNLMTHNEGKSMLYTGYELAGHHTPFLDIAMPMYFDCFFEAVYADWLHEELRENEGEDTWVRQAMGGDLFDRHIIIDYHLRLDTPAKALAFTKLEYLLRPLLKMQDQYEASQRPIAEETLKYGLLTCALLGRDHTERPDVFLLNLALGVRLASDLRAMILESFGWSRWDE